jgi:DNA modification methylase
MSALVIEVGDCLEVLRRLPADSVHCVVTSPPYYGLRDYGVAGQIGLEPSLAEFLAKLVGVFEEVRRVLRPDGTCWVNMGDTYAGGGNGGGGSYANDGIRAAKPGTDKNVPHRNGQRGCGHGIKPKDLMGVPWRLAFALQDAGWYLRQDIVWAKPNPMPESIKDRCTKAHEYVFLLTKAPNYYFDREAMSEPCSPNTHERRAQLNRWDTKDYVVPGQKPQKRKSRAAAASMVKPNGWHSAENYHEADPRRKLTGKPHGRHALGEALPEKERRAAWTPKVKGEGSMDAALNVMPARRNRRSVWTIASKGYKGAHFATFPADLVRPCILAGSPLGGVVLDPFGGSGTVGEVALQEGRRAFLIELNPEYAAMARERTAVQMGLRPQEPAIPAQGTVRTTSGEVLL